MVIWISGLSGAGKTTLGTALFNRLKASHSNLVILDGDDLRNALILNIGHDQESRRVNSNRYANIAHLLDSQGIHVIVCAVSISNDAQKLNRQRLSNYLEVYLDVPLEVLKARDPKGIYRKAEKGLISNVSGVDIPYDPPLEPHITVPNDKSREFLETKIDEIVSIFESGVVQKE